MIGLEYRSRLARRGARLRALDPEGEERTIENTPVGTVIMNVVTPTLTAYRPARGKATGTGVIIAPGGAFVALAISLEATDLVKWLQQRGIADGIQAPPPSRGSTSASSAR